MILGIDPKVDYAFKKLFGNEAYKWLSIDLLNAVLQDAIAEPLVDVELLNPFSDKDGLDDKQSVLDIKARDASGRLYNIEMQMVPFASYPKRALYYWSRTYQQQLHAGEDYRELRPTISIHFVNGILIPPGSYHQEFGLLSRQDPSIVFCPDLAIHLIELPKFAKTLEELSDSLERWCYFLRYGAGLETTALPGPLRTPPIEQAVEVLRIMTQTDIERERYEAREKGLRDESSRLDWAERKGIEKGREEGIEKGIEKGRQEELVNSIEILVELKFGNAANDIMAKARQTNDITDLKAIQQVLRTAQSIEELRLLMQTL